MATVTSLNIMDEIRKTKERIPVMDHILSKGLTQPFNSTNSGSRKIMYGTHREHVLPILNPEIALVSTGHENEFGRRSSSFKIADVDYRVLGKVSKFSHIPNHEYYLIMLNTLTKELNIIHRTSYCHITESYGYLFNNTFLDSLSVNDYIDSGTVLQKSTSYDEFNNRMDGVNLTTAYLSCDKTMEDSILLSDVAAEKLVSPLIKTVTIMINDNDIPLNLYGNDDYYKTFPDIGEFVDQGILCSLRRDNKEEALYNQSYNRLKDIMMSDEKFLIEGEVIDIRIYCNNPTKLEDSYYNSQIKKYYDDDMRFRHELTATVENILSEYKCNMGYDLQKLYYISKDIISGKQYMKDRPFSNIIMDIVVMHKNKIGEGDKLSDRYGGKGVVGKIIPVDLMPRLSDGTPVDIIFNSSTCVNRENAGQLFETSVNHISSRIIEFIRLNVLDVGECIDMFLKFVRILNKEQADYVENMLDEINEDSLYAFLNSIIEDDGITLSLRPISDSMTIDTLNELYKEFPWAKQHDLMVPIKDSNGNIRYIKSRRPIIAGKKYIYRLKQYAEEKFSVTSLSATNIRNENSRSKTNKTYKGRFTKTPIRFGEMETGDMAHLGMEYVIVNLMLHSASPHARRLSEELLTGDPFNINIKLDTEAKNRNVEILNAYLKTMGLRLIFEKVYKNKKKVMLIQPIKFLKPDPVKPVCFKHKDEYHDRDYLTKMLKNQSKLVKPILFKPIRFIRKT